MPIDTPGRRRAAMAAPWGELPLPDGSIGQGDRMLLLGLYPLDNVLVVDRGIFFGALLRLGIWCGALVASGPRFGPLTRADE